MFVNVNISVVIDRNPVQDNNTNISTEVSEIVETSNTNLLTLIPINSLNIPPTSQSFPTSDQKKMSPLTRVMFSVQSGSPFSLKKKMISTTFSHFGVITFVFYQNGLSFGFVNFRSWIALPDLDQPGNLLFSLERFINHHHQGILQEVRTNHLYLGNKVNGVQVVVVSFKDSLVAKGLMGTNHGRLEVLEVCRRVWG